MNFVLLSGIKRSLTVSLAFLFLFVLQDSHAQPAPCNCDPFDAACIEACDNGGGTPPVPCNCDPFDNQCIMDHPECYDGQSIPIDSNIWFLAIAMSAFGLWKIMKTRNLEVKTEI